MGLKEDPEAVRDRAGSMVSCRAMAMASEAGPNPTQSRSCISSAGTERRRVRLVGAWVRGAISDWKGSSDFRGIGSIVYYFGGPKGEIKKRRIKTRQRRLIQGFSRTGLGKERDRRGPELKREEARLMQKVKQEERRG